MSLQILRRDDPVAVSNLISAMREEATERIRIQDMCEEVLYNQHRIPVPKDLPEGEVPVEVKTGIGYAQIGLLKGIYQGRPVRRAIPLDDTDDGRTAAEARENFLQNVYPALEVQQGQVFDKMFMDVCTYGYGARYLCAVPQWLDKAVETAKKRMTKQEAGEYARRREDEMRRLSLPDRQLPFVYRHVPSRQILWREAQDVPGGGLEVVCEMQQRNVASLLANPLYAGKMPVLRQRYLDAQEKGNAYNMQTLFYLVETPDLVTYYAMGEYLQDGNNDQKTPQTEGSKGEIAYQYPNPLGRPRYVITPGLVTSSERLAYQHMGVLTMLMPLIKALDFMLTARMTQLKDWTWPLHLAESLGSPNADDIATGKDGKLKKWEFQRGGFMNQMPPGWSYRVVTNPGLGAEADHLFELVYNLLNLQAIPDQLFQSKSGDSGYLYASIVQSVLARFRPIQAGVELGETRLDSLMLANMRLLNEPLSVVARQEIAA